MQQGNKKIRLDKKKDEKNILLVLGLLGLGRLGVGRLEQRRQVRRVVYLVPHVARLGVPGDRRQLDLVGREGRRVHRLREDFHCERQRGLDVGPLVLVVFVAALLLLLLAALSRVCCLLLLPLVLLLPVLLLLLVVVRPQDRLRRRGPRPDRRRLPAAVVAGRVRLVELEAALAVPARVEQRDAVRPQPAELGVALLGVAEGADELLDGDGLAEGEGVALGGEAGGVDEDVGIG